MRIGLLIGALSRGGMERQLVELAVGLKQRGHDVELVAYDGPGSFDHLVEMGGVTLRHMHGGSKRDKLRAVREWMQRFDPQIVHGAMKRASTLAVLANLPGRRRAVVATDFSTASYGRHKPVLWASLGMFAFADVVITETEMNRRNLVAMAPWLRAKTHVIRNGVDVERFAVPPRPTSTPSRFRLVSVGRVYAVKNAARIVEALHMLRQRGVTNVWLDWYGRYERVGGGLEPEYEQATRLIERHGLHDMVAFRGEIERIEEAYRSADGLIHASIQEGIPNAVVEGMACGLPVVASGISDLPLILHEARNGFLCDAQSPDSIADAIQRLAALSPEERAAMAARSREVVIDWFGRDRYITEYECLYQALARETR